MSLNVFTSKVGCTCNRVTSEHYRFIAQVDLFAPGPWFEDRPMKNIMIGNRVHQDGLIVEPDWIVIGALLAAWWDNISLIFIALIHFLN